MQDIEIIHFPSEEEPFAVIKKSGGIPSAPITAFDTQSAFSRAASEIPCLRVVQGRKEIEHGLLHRLDTETQGLLLIAANQKFYDFMLEEQARGRFIKTYRAECEFLSDNASVLGGFPKEFPLSEFLFDTDGCDLKDNESTGKLRAIENIEYLEIHSYFRNFGKGNKEVRPVTEKSGGAAIKKLSCKKRYRTRVKIVERRANTFFVECRLKSGYRHQVRCHLAWNCLPIKGDRLYNFLDRNVDTKKRPMAFQACAIDFYNPFSGRWMHFEIK